MSLLLAYVSVSGSARSRPDYGLGQHSHGGAGQRSRSARQGMSVQLVAMPQDASPAAVTPELPRRVIHASGRIVKRAREDETESELLKAAARLRERAGAANGEVMVSVPVALAVAEWLEVTDMLCERDVLRSDDAIVRYGVKVARADQLAK